MHDKKETKTNRFPMYTEKKFSRNYNLANIKLNILSKKSRKKGDSQKFFICQIVLKQPLTPISSGSSPNREQISPLSGGAVRGASRGCGPPETKQALNKNPPQLRRHPL